MKHEKTLFDVSKPMAGAVASQDVHRRRISPAHRRLLAEFLLPNSANAVARSAYWKEVFRQPVKSVLGRLKAQGLLVEPVNPRARMCYARDESDLRVLCLEHGLQPMGNADQLADRLLTIDPTGWLLGYAGELLQCSELAARTLAAQCHLPQSRIEGGRSDDEAILETLKGHARQTARAGNLALCRNVHVAIANHLQQRNKRTKALQALCVVCVFDLCGARDRDDVPAHMRRTYSRFDPNRAALTPWLVRRVSDLSREMALSMDEIGEIFIRVGTRLRVPRDAQELWAAMRLALAAHDKEYDNLPPKPETDVGSMPPVVARDRQPYSEKAQFS